MSLKDKPDIVTYRLFKNRIKERIKRPQWAKYGKMNGSNSNLNICFDLFSLLLRQNFDKFIHGFMSLQHGSSFNPHRLTFLSPLIHPDMQHIRVYCTYIKPYIPQPPTFLLIHPPVSPALSQDPQNSGCRPGGRSDS